MDLLYCILASITLAYVEASCSFPSDLRGYSWYTTSNGEITVPADGSSMQNFVSHIKAGTLTLSCSEYDTATDRYISTATFSVFSSIDNTKAFFCMKFTKITAMKYTMTYETDLEDTTSTRVVVITNVTGTLTPSEACSLTSSQAVGTQELLVRSDSVSSSVIACPSSLQFNLSATIQSAECTGSTIHGAVTTSQHTYSYASCVTDKYTSAGIFDCIYTVIDEPYTYLTVFNNDSTVDEKTTYRYLCYVIWSSGHIVYYTYYPQICQISQTPVVTDTDGVAVIAYNNNLSSDVASQISVCVIFSLFLLIVIVLTIVLLVIYIKGPTRPKIVMFDEHQPTQESKSISESKPKIKESKPKTEESKPQKDEKKKSKRKKKKKVTEKTYLTSSIRRTGSMNEKKKNLKWTEVIGINSNIKEYNKPIWQIKWEQYKDPIWGKKVVNDDPETARSTDSITSTSKIIMVVPEREEQSRDKSLWETVYRLWYEPRKPIPENKYEQQKLAKLAQPKYVRFIPNGKTKTV